LTVEIKRRENAANPQLPADLHPVLRRVFAARGASEETLNLSLKSMIPVSELGGLDIAVERLLAAQAMQERVLVLGDYDSDGATATALMMSCLKAFGFDNILYLVPDRFKFGYGLSVGIVDEAAQHSPDVIITVDNGISSIDGVARANTLGIDVIVTDHHLPGDALPEAVAVINPNSPGETFPSKWLSGVGVAFYTMAALGQALAADGVVDPSVARTAVTDCLDLVAVGTVADLVQMDYNNRILVAQGLERIRAGRARPGVRALFEAAGKDVSSAVASDLGFAIGPRLNAAGRLSDISKGIDCLLAADLAVAKPMADELDRLNKERRELQSQMQEDADVLLDALEQKLAGAKHWGYCLFDDGWHQGIVGLVATKMRDRTRRPSVAFAPAEEGSEELKGSARSVKGVHLRDILAAVDAKHPRLIDKFGGHAMAAGLSIQKERLGEFVREFDNEVANHKDEISDIGVVDSDGELSDSDFSMLLAETLRVAAPWGQAFPEPVFDNRFRVVDKRVVGQRHLKLQLQPEGSRKTIDAIAFNCDELPRREAGDSDGLYTVAYKLDVNSFRGRKTLQLLVEHISAS